VSLDERRPEGHVDPVHGVAPVEETSADGGRARRPGELGPRELLRWTWRQVTSMRTALVLLLLLALAAVPGSVIPQSGVDALKVTQWKDQHPQLTPLYERLGLFSVYDSAWFSAIYLLLMISLVGCILPRTLVYLRALRGTPPAAPRNLTRLPDHTTYTTDEDVEVVLERARAVLRRRRYRLRPADAGAADGLAVSAERGYLREAGNLLFHVSVLVVLAGFAIGGLFGYQGGVIINQGATFANNLTSYDDFDPGSLFGPDDLDPFTFTVDDFSADWLRSGPGKGTARAFSSDLTYRDGVDGPEQSYDLRVNHPLTIGDTDVFLIGHGYSPRLTIRDGRGQVVSTDATPFLPQDQSFLSFGVVKPRNAQPAFGLEGLFYPAYVLADGNPVTVTGEDLNPTLSMTLWTGDLGYDDGSAQSVYILDKDGATQIEKADGTPYRVDLQPGQTQQLPDGLGSVTFDGVQPWVRVQISQTPGKGIALVGVVLALVGLLGSLFIRPRRVWVRVRRADGQGAGATMVEVAALDRSGGGDVTGVLEGIVADLRGQPAPSRRNADGDDGETSR